VQESNGHAQDVNVNRSLTKQNGQVCFKEDAERYHVVAHALFCQADLTSPTDGDVGPLHDHNAGKD